MRTLRELLDEVEQLDKDYQRAAENERIRKKELDDAKQDLQDAMVEQGTNTASKEGFKVTNVDKERPQAVDWEAVYAYIKRTGSFQLIERRLSAKAYAEVVESRGGKEIPGTKVYKYQQLKITRG